MAKVCLIDIGNSTVEWAEYRHRKIGRKHRCLTTEFSAQIPTLVKTYPTLMIASVVPSLNRLFPRRKSIHFVHANNIPVLKINIKKPKQVGADRLVAALGAYSKIKGPTLIVDSGTATTVCYVNQNGFYQGGIICPGLNLSAKALQLYTAKIPLVPVRPIQKPIGKTTQEAVQIGLYQGLAHMVNGFIAVHRQRSIGLKVVGTGMGTRLLKSNLDLDFYDPKLVLAGLAICADQLQ